jgi:hypothetical protein
MQEDEAIDCRHFDHAAWLLISGELDDDACSAWKRHIAGCGECAGLLAARRRVLDVYDATGTVPEGALDLSRLPVPIRRQPMWGRPAIAIAAALLLVIAGVIAGRVTSRHQNGDALRDVQQRLNDLEVQLAMARMEQSTAAERLKAAAAGVMLVHRDPRIVESLLDALESDPSPNVRMAVVDALYTIDAPTRVRERFEPLLAAQDSPILQVALIELAADRRFVETLGALKRVVAEPGDEAVRHRAQWAIGVLSR